MKILNKLTIKHLKQNPRRTIVTIIGIILSTSLMVGIGLLFSSVRDMVEQLIVQEAGPYHVMIEVPSDKMDLVSQNQNVKEYYYSSLIGYSRYASINNDYKPYIKVLGVNDNYLNHLNLKDGRLPSSDSEILISEHINTNGEAGIRVGDKLVLNIGKRVTNDGSAITEENYNYAYDEEKGYIADEKLIDTKQKEYTVVGIVARDVNESYSSCGYSAFTIASGDVNDVYIIYNKAKKTEQYTDVIASNLGYVKANGEYDEVYYNYDLLAINGVTRYENIIGSLSAVICIILALVSIACIIVIYNSFAISVMERKKQFGLFASIGTTRKQLKHTVFYEAFIVGLIGIPLGVLAAYVGIGTVLYIINRLLVDAFDGVKLNLVTYPLFIIIPVIFMIVTILVSALIPAKLASRVSPIEAIRQNDDIKIKSKKVKSPKIINKLFGVEGDIAYKNMKRNKKKYRVTIISLFISIVLFISFSSIVKYGLEGSLDLARLPEYEYVLSINSAIENRAKADELASKILSVDGIKKYTSVRRVSLRNIDADYKYTDDAKKYGLGSTTLDYTEIIGMDNDQYHKYIKSLGLKEDRPIVVNRHKNIVYTSNTRKAINIKIFDSISDYSIAFYDYETEQISGSSYKLSNLYLTTELPMGMESSSNDSLMVIVSEDVYNEIMKISNNAISYDRIVFFLADNYDEITKVATDDTVDKTLAVNIYNIAEELRLITNIIIVIKILLYGFISLVTLIGVTSVLNTINTSIALRRKEFAVLRSIGLTPKGFNKMLFFESLFFGLKSLLYGIPVALLVTWLLHSSMMGLVEFDHLIIPYQSICIAIVGVFAVVMISMLYATRKIKKENILNAIREENI